MTYANLYGCHGHTAQKLSISPVGRDLRADEMFGLKSGSRFSEGNFRFRASFREVAPGGFSPSENSLQTLVLNGFFSYF